MTERKHLGEFHQDPRNARRHTERNLAAVQQSIREVGFMRPIVAAQDGTIVGGNLTSEALADLDMTDVIVVRSDGTKAVVHIRDDVQDGSELAIKGGLYDNLAGDMADGFHEEVLAELLQGIDIPAVMWDPEEATLIRAGAMLERFGVPPFSSLDTRQEYWQERRAAWEAQGVAGDQDPVVAEIAIRWFTPGHGAVLDPWPFSEVVARVAEHLGHRYIGPGEGEADLVLSLTPVIRDGYEEEVAAAVQGMAQDRMAVVVVPPGPDLYRTIDAWEAAGAALYNEAVVIAQEPETIRPTSQVLAVQHAILLGFLKGDAKTIRQWGDVEAGAPGEDPDSNPWEFPEDLEGAPE